MRKMWIVIVSESLVNLYSYLYSQVIYLNPDPSRCNYFDVYIYNWATITNRLIVDVLWCLPIIYIFWPHNRTWYGTVIAKTKSSSRFSTFINERNNSAASS